MSIADLRENGHELGGKGLGRVGPLNELVNTDWGALQEREGWEGGWGSVGEGVGVWMG